MASHATRFAHPILLPKCFDCGFTGIPKDLMKHLAVRRHEQAFKCSQCPNTFFKYKNSCNLHITDNHPTPHQCKICKRYFIDAIGLAAHKSTSSHNHPCEYCSIVFISKKEREKHEVAEHTSMARDGYKATAHAYPCDVCKAAFGSMSEMVQHSITHYLTCKRCPEESFSDINSLLQHVDTAHKFGCNLCDAAFGTQLELYTHSSEDHDASQSSGSKHDPAASFPRLGPTPLVDVVTFEPLAAASINSTFFKCDDCPKTLFTTKLARDQHTKDAHGLEIDANDEHGTMQYECIHCGLEFELQMELVQHVVNKHFLPCEECPGSRFSNSKELTEHAAKEHMPMTSASSYTQTDAVVDPVGTDMLGLDSNDTSMETSEEFLMDASVPEMHYALPQQAYDLKESGTQTTEHRCDECVAVFEDEEELQQHLDHSPFHGPRLLKCNECLVMFVDQISLLKHIESKPHKTKWVLSMI